MKGVLRHDLAMGADLRRYDQGTRDDIADRMNRRPQQTLNACDELVVAALSVRHEPA